MGFSGSVNGTTKNPGVLDFGFCQCKWALCVLYSVRPASPTSAKRLTVVLPWHGHGRHGMAKAFNFNFKLIFKTKTRLQ